MTRLDNYKDTLTRCPEAARQLLARAREDETITVEDWRELLRCAIDLRAISRDELLPQWAREEFLDAVHDITGRYKEEESDDA